MDFTEIPVIICARCKTPQSEKPFKILVKTRVNKWQQNGMQGNNVFVEKEFGMCGDCLSDFSAFMDMVPVVKDQTPALENLLELS